MKYLLLILLCLVPYENIYYKVVIKPPVELMNKSIDFVTNSINEKKDYYLKLKIYELSDRNRFFEYRLSQGYYIEELQESDRNGFFRSNGILIAIDPQDTAYVNRNIYHIRDSLDTLSEEFNSIDNFIFHSIGWSFFQVRYQHDTLIGTINFKEPIHFDRMDIE